MHPLASLESPPCLYKVFSACTFTLKKKSIIAFVQVYFFAIRFSKKKKNIQFDLQKHSEAL